MEPCLIHSLVGLHDHSVASIRCLPCGVVERLRYLLPINPGSRKTHVVLEMSSSNYQHSLPFMLAACGTALQPARLPNSRTGLLVHCRRVFLSDRHVRRTLGTGRRCVIMVERCYGTRTTAKLTSRTPASCQMLCCRQRSDLMTVADLWLNSQASQGRVGAIRSDAAVTTIADVFAPNYELSGSKHGEVYVTLLGVRLLLPRPTAESFNSDMGSFLLSAPQVHAAWHLARLPFAKLRL